MLIKLSIYLIYNVTFCEGCNVYIILFLVILTTVHFICLAVERRPYNSISIFSRISSVIVLSMMYGLLIPIPLQC